MSKKREFPILNGKLISDLDANGHKIIGADIEVPAEKIKEAVAPELEAKADKTELEAETQRATGVEATLGNAITAEAQRAQEAEAALREAVEGKVDKVEGKGLSSNDYTNEDKAKLGTAYTPDNPPPAPDMSGYATKNEIPYSLIEVTLADRINLTDRAVNKVTADGSLNHIQFVFPEKKAGKSRDFFLRLIITGETVPTLSFSEPNGGSVSFDADYDSWADIEQGVNILMFTDTEA